MIFLVVSVLNMMKHKDLPCSHIFSCVANNSQTMRMLVSRACEWADEGRYLIREVRQDKQEWKYSHLNPDCKDSTRL